MGPELAETVRFAQRRGLPFSVGPLLPSGVERFASNADWPLLLASSEQGIEDQVDALIGQGYLPQREISSPDARVLFHERPDDGEWSLAVAFVLNPTSRDLQINVACPGYDARDALTHAPILSFAERLSLRVSAESIRMLELSPR
jgi:hypothetical protein